MLGAFELFLSDGVMVHYHNMDFNRGFKGSRGKAHGNEACLQSGAGLVHFHSHISSSFCLCVCVCVLIQ